MSDLPKLPGGWVWDDEPFTMRWWDDKASFTAWATNRKNSSNRQGIHATRPTSADAIARVVAMVTAIVEKEATDAK